LLPFSGLYDVSIGGHVPASKCVSSAAVISGYFQFRFLCGVFILLSLCSIFLVLIILVFLFCNRLPLIVFLYLLSKSLHYFRSAFLPFLLCPSLYYHPPAYSLPSLPFPKGKNTHTAASSLWFISWKQSGRVVSTN
jgi:hypothetical protein